MKSCERCGEPVAKTHPNRAGRFCSRACYHAAGRDTRVEKTIGTRLRRAPNHPLAPPSGIVAECRLVLYEKIGPGSHPCHWCGQSLRWLPGDRNATGALVADHLDWDVHNNNPANLVPSCRVCNAHRTREGDRRLIRDDELSIVASNGSRHRAVNRECETCGTTFVARVAQIRTGKGRFCTRSCARRAPR